MITFDTAGIQRLFQPAESDALLLEPHALAEATATQIVEQGPLLVGQPGQGPVVRDILPSPEGRVGE